MSVLKHLFNSRIDQRSLVFPDFDLVKQFDKQGKEVPTFVKTDYEKIVASHGSVDFWSLDALMLAGINPDMPISTSASTRLYGDDAVESAIAEAMPEIEKLETPKTE